MTAVHAERVARPVRVTPRRPAVLLAAVTAMLVTTVGTWAAPVVTGADAFTTGFAVLVLPAVSRWFAAVRPHVQEWA